MSQSSLSSVVERRFSSSTVGGSSPSGSASSFIGRQCKGHPVLQDPLYRTLSENLPGFGIFIFDSSMRYVVAMGDEILGSLGLAVADVVGRTVDETGFPGSVDDLRGLFLAALSGSVMDAEIRRDGRVFELRFAPVKSGVQCPTGMMTIHEITETVRARETMRAMSLTDDLTGAYNRRGFMLLARQQMKVLDRSEIGALLFFADLNDLKLINDAAGHAAGDEALRSTASVLASAFRESDIVARYGGDEFVVLASGVSRDMEPVFRERIQRAVTEHNSSSATRLSFSVGASYYDPDRPSTLDQLLCEADKAMYANKRYRRANGSSQMAAVRPEEHEAVTK